jgi:ribose/xylose/arabinose/galactoside ABC-type transport system permease subunit
VLKASSVVTKKLVATWQLRRTESQLLLGVVVLSAVYSFLYPASFPTLANVLEMSRVGGILFVAAMAQSFALIVGGFDISVAANMGFVSIVSALYMAEGGSVVIGVILGLLGGTGVGLTNGILIGRLGVTPFVATLGSLTFLYGLSDQLSDGGSVAGLPTTLSWLGRSDWGPRRVFPEYRSFAMKFLPIRCVAFSQPLPASCSPPAFRWDRVHSGEDTSFYR